MANITDLQGDTKPSSYLEEAYEVLGIQHKCLENLHRLFSLPDKAEQSGEVHEVPAPVPHLHMLLADAASRAREIHELVVKLGSQF